MGQRSLAHLAWSDQAHDRAAAQRKAQLIGKPPL
jgi:hypothetical protein